MAMAGAHLDAVALDRAAVQPLGHLARHSLRHLDEGVGIMHRDDVVSVYTLD